MCSGMFVGGRSDCVMYTKAMVQVKCCIECTRKCDQ